MIECVTAKLSDQSGLIAKVIRVIVILFIFKVEVRKNYLTHFIF